MPGDDALRETGDRIEVLLADIERSAGPVTWQRVEELMRRIIELYGAGLQRTLALAEGAGADREALAAAIRRDELVASLMILHDLHPESTVQRVERALDEVRPYLASHAGGVDLLGVDDGVVRLRMKGTCDGCPSSAITLEHAIRAAIEQAAPEVTSIVVEGRP